MKTIFGLFLLFLGTAHSQENECEPTYLQPMDYRQALCMSPLFYEAQRSGKLPPEQRVKWRGDSAMNDGADVGYDLTGGYYDAGDYVKFGLPLAFTVTALSWGMVNNAGGYSSGSQTDFVRESMRWGADFVLRMHIGSAKMFAQVGDPEIDHEYWGRPEDMDMERPAYLINSDGPGSDLAAESAAGLSAISTIFLNEDEAYHRECIAAAKQLFDFADNHRGIYSDTIDKAVGYYTSTSYGDELAWGALWMFIGTNEQEYMTKAESFIEEFELMEANPITFDWDDKTAGVYALMAELDGGNQYTSRLEQYVDTVMSQTHTPGGMVYLQEWGSLRAAINVAYIATRAAALSINSNTYYDWAQSQLDYALGSNGRSFVTGFGENPPTHIHHAASSCPDPPATCDWDNYDSPDPNPQTIYGGLVGGPDENDGFTDSRDDDIHNEVAIDYNALYTSLLAVYVGRN